MAKLANIGQTNAATQGQELTNQNNALGLQVSQARTAPMLAYLRQQAGGALAPFATSSSAAPSGSGAQGGLAAMAAPPAGQPVAQGGLAAAASPGGQPPPQGGGAAQAGAPLHAPGDMAEALYGVAMPPLQALSMGVDPKALDGILKARSAVLYQYAQSATPQTWDSHISDLMQQGWLSSRMGTQLLGHPELQPRILQSLASPDAGLSATTTMLGQGLTTDANGSPVASGAAIGAKGAIAGAETTGRNQSDLTYKPQIDQAENGPLADRAGLIANAELGSKAKLAQATPRTLAPGQTLYNPPLPDGSGAPGTNQPARAVDLLNTGAIPASAFAARINGTENATGNPAAQNPRSNAMGNGQFIPTTWLQLVRQTRPDLAGQSDQQLLALRGNPGMAAQMTAAYGQQNVPILQQAGLPVTSATLGMAHRLGPNDAVAVMNANPARPLTSILSPKVLAENPDLAQQTVGSFIRSSANKYGNQPVSFGGQDQSAPAASPIVPVAASAGGRLPLARADERFPAPAPNLALQPPGTPPNSRVPAPPGGGYAPAGAAGSVNAAPDFDPRQIVNVDSLAAGQGLPAGTPMRLPDGSVTVKGSPPGGGTVATAAPATPLAPPAGSPSPAPIAPPSQISIQPLPGGGTAVSSSVTPAGLKQQEADIGSMTTYRQGLLSDAQHAVATNSLVDGMRADAANFQQGGGMNASWREMSEDLNNVSTFFGGKPIQGVADWEAYNKAAGQLVREAASGVSSQVGAQELGMIQRTLLSDQTSAAGFSKIADQLQGLADYKIAKSAASGSATGNPNSFEGSWAQHVTPLAFMVNRMSSADAQQLAAGLGQSQQGRALLKSLSTQMAYADQSGLFRMLP